LFKLEDLKTSLESQVTSKTPPKKDSPVRKRFRVAELAYEEAKDIVKFATAIYSSYKAVTEDLKTWKAFVGDDQEKHKRIIEAVQTITVSHVLLITTIITGEESCEAFCNRVLSYFGSWDNWMKDNPSFRNFFDVHGTKLCAASTGVTTVGLIAMFIGLFVAASNPVGWVIGGGVLIGVGVATFVPLYKARDAAKAVFNEAYWKEVKKVNKLLFEKDNLDEILNVLKNLNIKNKISSKWESVGVKTSECSICLQSVKDSPNDEKFDKAPVRTDSCDKHFYHRGCLDGWRAKNSVDHLGRHKCVVCQVAYTEVIEVK